MAQTEENKSQADRYMRQAGRLTAGAVAGILSLFVTMFKSASELADGRELVVDIMKADVWRACEEAGYPKKHTEAILGLYEYLCKIVGGEWHTLQDFKSLPWEGARAHAEARRKLSLQTNEETGP